MTALPLTLPSITIDAIGHPAPKGSKRCVGSRGKAKHVLVEMSPLLDNWTEQLTAAAAARRRLTRWDTCHGAVAVEIWAWFPRPASATRPFPSARSVGDIDKIARGCLDPLKVAGVIADDSLVVDLDVHERYAQPGRPTGARIVVNVLP